METQKKEEVLLRHFSHKEHPLILEKLYVNRVLLRQLCHGCYEWISLLYDDDPYCYRCEECEYYLHKLCAEAPLSVHHHPLHQDHPLQLLEKPPNEGDACTTDCCKRPHRRGFTYHCSTCKFNIDILCATAAERKEFRHFSHLQHPLVLKKLPPQVIRPNTQDHHHAAINNIGAGDGDGSDGVNYPAGLLDHTCKGCFQKISLYGEPYWYRCDRGCDYDLHKLCAEAPLFIQQHPLHQLHPLQLLTKPLSKAYKGSECDVGCCEGSWEGFTYQCSTCKFDIDILCATTGERKVYNPHHNHLLSLFRTITTRCNACGIKDEGAFYQCTTCVHFWLHEDCALLPKEILIHEANTGEDNYHHDHPLTIAYGLIHHHARHSPACRVCKSQINEYLWIYSCEKCRYFVHIHCCTMKPTPHPQLYGLFDTFLSRLFGDEPPVLELPLGDEFHSLMEHMLLSLNYDNFAKNNEADANIANNIVHDHPLILQYDHMQEDGIVRDDDKNNIDEQARSIIPLHNPMKRIELLCNACVRPIAQFPFYKCGGEQQHKDFFLHKWCAELPNELPHRLFHIDQHPLMLLRNVPKFFGIFTCKICDMPSNGFAYGCMGCEYYIDVRCAFMPVSIKHGAHPEHVLHLQESKKEFYRESCSGCRYRDWDWMFHCDECNKFKLCPNCAQLPKTMRHKYDKHLLQLMYLPPQDHISQYFCDICEQEKEMDPNKWFYHCADCDQQVHVRCSRIGFGIKCGGSITIKHHPHHLTFAKWRTGSDITCDHCSSRISFGFYCVQCKYRVHWFCVSKIDDDSDRSITQMLRWYDNNR